MHTEKWLETKKQKQFLMLEVMRINFSIFAAHSVSNVLCYKLSTEWFNHPIHPVSHYSQGTVGHHGFSKPVFKPEQLQRIQREIILSTIPVYWHAAQWLFKLILLYFYSYCLLYFYLLHFTFYVILSFWSECIQWMLTMNLK